jgi:Fe2+ or Zn2+ uptake regulation protein
MMDDISDLEIAVLCDLLQGPDVNLRAHKRVVLDQLVSKGLVEPVNDGRSRYQISQKAHHILAERGVGIGEG